VNAELDIRARRATADLRLSADAVDPVGRLHDLRRAERRRSRAQVAAAFAMLVALVAAGLLARRYDPPATGPLPSLATITVGEQPTGMAVGGGSLWVMNQGSGTVSRIDPAAGRVVATVPVGAPPTPSPSGATPSGSAAGRAPRGTSCAGSTSGPTG
jgi:YVTN family beta-propeller protein